jgi:hypothetical protein
LSGAARQLRLELPKQLVPLVLLVLQEPKRLSNTSLLV